MDAVFVLFLSLQRYCTPTCSRVEEDTHLEISKSARAKEAASDEDFF